MGRSVVFDLIANSRQFERGFDRAHKKATGFQKTMGRLGSAAAGAIAGGAIISGVKRFADAARESQLVAAQTEAVIKSTGGAAGVSAKGFADLATAISKKVAVDDEVIQSGQNILATFTNIKNSGPDKVFDRATAAAVDMAAALNQGQVTADGLKSANLQLGKALNDPIKGISALTRVGVTFTQKQKDQIAAMVKAGDTAGAQKVILAELSKEFGGSAAAAATSGKKLSVAWGNAQEVLGNLLLPAIERGQELLIGFIGVVDRNRTAFALLGGAIAATTGFVVAMTVATKVSLAVQKAIKVATIAWAAAQWLLNTALTANPIGLVVVAVAALVAGLILAYKNSRTFRDVVGKAFDFVRDKVGAVVSFIIGAVRGWLNVQLTVVAGILRVMGKLPGPMGAPFRKAEEAVRKAKDTVNAQLDKIQARVNKLRGKDIPITASLKLNFTKSFTQADWVQVRLAAGRMAQGGRVPGGFGGGDRVPILAEPGEAVVDKTRTRRYAPLLAAMGVPGFAAGGVVGQIDTENRAINRVQARGTSARLDTGITALLRRYGAGSAAIKAFIRGTDPLPYLWGGVGPFGYDCSGLAGEVYARHTRRPHFRRWFTTQSNFGALGFKPGAGGVYTIGVDRAGGHMAGRYGNLAFEAANTRAGIRVGGDARSVLSFPAVYHMAKGGLVEELARRGVVIGGDPGKLRVLDGGGYLHPGVNVVANRTGKPERVLGARERVIDRAAARMIAEELARVIPATIAVDDVHAGLLAKKRRQGRSALGLS